MARSRDSNRVDLSLSPIRGIDPALIRELNDRLDRITSSLSKLEGRGDRTPTYLSTVDLGGHRVSNAAASLQGSDYVTRGEVEQHALYAKHDKHTATGVIDAPKGMRVPITRHMDQVVPLKQIRAEIARAIAAAGSGGSGNGDELFAWFYGAG